MYQALYREERPEVFSEILGQEHIVKILKHQIETDSVNHAYLFCGTRGTGKTTTARILAKAVNCLDENNKPCGICDHCKAIQQGTFMDVIEIDAASNNGVENIRELRESVKYPPALGKKKIYIIDEVHMLSTGAFNALLKTLEEPPENVIFILATTEPQKLPQTILSRCMRLDFKRVPMSTLVEGFGRICKDRGVEITESALKIVANAADGSVRDGLSVLDQVLASGEKKIDRDDVLEYIGAVSDDFFIELTELVSLKKVSDALVLLDNILKDGKDVKQLMKDWVSHYRNLLVTKFVKNPEDMLNMSTENVQKIREQSQRTSMDEINEAIIRLSKTINDARYSTQPRILLELAIVTLATGMGAKAVQQTVAPVSRAKVEQATAYASRTQGVSEASSLKSEVETASVHDEYEEPRTQSLDETSATYGSNTSKETMSPDFTIDIPDDNELDIIWHDVIEAGEDEAGSFGLVRTGTALTAMNQKQFKVFCHSPFAKKYCEEMRRTLEKLMENRVGKHLEMVLVLDNQRKPKEENEVDVNEIAKDISETLGIEIEVE